MKNHRQISHASWAEHREETHKWTHNRLNHNSYRDIEHRHSSHQIDSLALTAASVNQLPWSSEVNNRVVSVGSIVRSSQGLKGSFINPRRKKAKMLSKANAKIELFWAVHSEGWVHFLSPKLSLVWTVWKLFLSLLYALTFRLLKSEEFPHQVAAPRY